MPVADQLWRTVLATLPFSLAPWAAVNADSTELVVGVVVVGALLGFAVAAAVLHVLQVPSGSVLGLVSVLLAGFVAIAGALLGLAWVVSDGSQDLPAVGLLPFVLTSVIGATLAVLFLNAGRRGVPVAVPVVGLAIAAVLPVVALIGAFALDSRAEDDALRSDLEATGVPAYLPQLDGYVVDYVAGGDELDAGFSDIRIFYRAEDRADEVSRPFDLDLGIRPLPSGDPCQDIPGGASAAAGGIAGSSCVVDGDVVRVTNSFVGDSVSVLRDDAMISLDASDRDGGVDLEAFIPALQGADRVSYDDLVDAD